MPRLDLAISSYPRKICKNLTSVIRPPPHKPLTIPTMATSSEKVSALVHHQEFFLPCGRRHEDTHASHSTRDVSRNFFSLGTGESICSVCMAEEPRPAIQGAYRWTGGRMDGGRWTTGESSEFCRFIKIINCRAFPASPFPGLPHSPSIYPFSPVRAS